MRNTKEKITYEEFSDDEIHTIESHKKRYARLAEYGLMIDAWRESGVLNVIWDLGNGNKEKYRYKGGKWY